MTVLVSVTRCCDGAVLRRYNSRVPQGLTHMGALSKVTPEDVEWFRLTPPPQSVILMPEYEDRTA